MSSKAVSGGELELSEFNFVELILFGIHSLDYLFTTGKCIHEATIIVFVAQKKVCEAQAHNLHITARRSTNTETAPYHRGQGHKLLKMHKWTS